MREKREAAAKAEVELKAAEEKRIADAKKVKPAPQPTPISMSSAPDHEPVPAKPKETCEFCGKEFSNIAVHIKKCKDNPDNVKQAPPAPMFDFKSEALPFLTKIAGEIKAEVIQAMKTEIEGMKKADSGKNTDLDVESIKAEIIKGIKANNPEFDLESIKGDIIKAIQENKQEPGKEISIIDARTGQKEITTNGLRYFVENFIKPRCRESGQAAKELLTHAHKGKILTLMLDVDSLTDK
jgi:hypothetical protein